MADVRSLLRSEQASRRISHPNLAYTKSGLLNCLVCGLIIKSESLWDGHVRSANHRGNLQRAQSGEAQDMQGTVSKKRKMSDETEDVRKKRKSTGLDEDATANADSQAPPSPPPPPPGEVEHATANGHGGVAGPAVPVAQSPPPASSVPTAPPKPALPLPIDEDEWAAFERDVVPLAHPGRPGDYAAATISAAPVSAAELAAQTNAERQQRRDAEVEDEQAEEVARLVEEFDVMEGLEERVKRLKEKREALRIAAGGDMVGVDGVDAEGEAKAPPLPDADDDNDDDDEEESDELDEWDFA